MSSLDLNLPKSPNPSSPTPAKKSHLWRFFVAILLIANLVCIWIRPTNSKEAKVDVITLKQTNTGHAFDEDVILKLKKAEAYREAALMIQQALSLPKIDEKRKAKLLKQEGDLWELAGDHGKALQAYYFSEKFNRGQNDELARETTQAIIEVLRRKGKYDALSFEIAQKNRERKGESNLDRDPIVAKIDGVEYKMSDFEASLHQFVDQRILELSAPNPSQKKEIEERIRKQYSAPYEKLQFLRQWVSQEVLYRESLNWKLEKHPKYEKMMDLFRKNLLRNLLIEQQVQIKDVSDLDLKNYIQSNKASLGLSTDPGEVTAEQIAQVRPTAEAAYRESKQKELGAKFQQRLQEQHQVEVFQEAFTEGAK